MTPTIMVPLDGSPDAEHALPWAIRLATQAGAAIRLVGVHAPPAIFLDGQTLVGSLIPDDAVRDREYQYLRGIEARVRKVTAMAVSFELIDGGVVPALAQRAQDLGPAWVVMTAHGRGPVARFFLGNTAAEFVRASPAPVLLVRPAAEEADLAIQPSVKHILVPLDGSDLAEAILPAAEQFGREFGADYSFVLALDGVPDIEAIAARHEAGLAGPWDSTVARPKADLYLEHVAERFRSKGLTAQSKVIAHGGTADRIVEAAAERPDTIIALATHGRGGLAKVVWGSVADQVVRRAVGPVLVFKPVGA